MISWLRSWMIVHLFVPINDWWCVPSIRSWTTSRVPVVEFPPISVSTPNFFGVEGGLILDFYIDTVIVLLKKSLNYSNRAFSLYSSVSSGLAFHHHSKPGLSLSVLPSTSDLFARSINPTTCNSCHQHIRYPNPFETSRSVLFWYIFIG